MKRYNVIKIFLSCIEDNDVVIFAGSNLSKEAFQFDREGNFYIEDTDAIALSVTIGIAMSTDKRVFLICEDSTFLKDFGSAAQAAVSKCKNIFYLILNSGYYQDSGKHPTIFNEISGLKGVLFNLGFVVHDYTAYLKNKNSINYMKNIVKTIRGPLVIFINIDVGIKKKINDIKYTKVELKNRICSFINKKEDGTSLFIPPALNNM